MEKIIKIEVLGAKYTKSLYALTDQGRILYKWWGPDAGGEWVDITPPLGLIKQSDE